MYNFDGTVYLIFDLISSCILFIFVFVQEGSGEGFYLNNQRSELINSNNF